MERKVVGLRGSEDPRRAWSELNGQKLEVDVRVHAMVGLGNLPLFLGQHDVDLQCDDRGAVDRDSPKGLAVLRHDRHELGAKGHKDLADSGNALPIDLRQEDTNKGAVRGGGGGQNRGQVRPGQASRTDRLRTTATMATLMTPDAKHVKTLAGHSAIALASASNTPT